MDNVWKKIIELEGQEFTQIRGKTFTYEVIGSSIKLSITNQLLSKATFKKALQFMPLQSTKAIQHLRGPSYIYAILMDERVCGEIGV